MIVFENGAIWNVIWEWRNLGMAQFGNGAIWEWRNLGMAQFGIAYMCPGGGALVTYQKD